jgi:hypothetical protein
LYSALSAASSSASRVFPSAGNFASPIEIVTDRRAPTEASARLWGLRFRFENTFNALNGKKDFDRENLMSIDCQLPELTTLIIELSQPTWGRNVYGKLLINKVPNPNLERLGLAGRNPAAGHRLLVVGPCGTAEPVGTGGLRAKSGGRRVSAHNRPSARRLTAGLGPHADLSPSLGSSFVRTQARKRDMLTSMSPTPPMIRMEIDVRAALLSALQKLSDSVPLSNAERFEISVLTFMTARALCTKLRPTYRS